MSYPEGFGGGHDNNTTQMICDDTSCPNVTRCRCYITWPVCSAGNFVRSVVDLFSYFLLSCPGNEESSQTIMYNMDLHLYRNVIEVLIA